MRSGWWFVFSRLVCSVTNAYKYVQVMELFWISDTV